MLQVVTNLVPMAGEFFFWQLCFLRKLPNWLPVQSSNMIWFIYLIIWLLFHDSVNKKQSFIAFLISITFSLRLQSESNENLAEKLEVHTVIKGLVSFSLGS